MDAYESENPSKNGTTQRSRVRVREVKSRYMSPTPDSQTTRCPSPTPNVPKRCPSPNAAPQRALSADRRRPSTPSRPTTPVHDTNVESLLASHKTFDSKLPDSLWPSTMRSLNSSFQSDTSEKMVPRLPSQDRSLRPPSNVRHMVEARKPTPERKPSPLKGRNSLDQVENSKPADILRHQWPSRASGKTSSNSLIKTDATLDKNSKFSSLTHTRMVPTITPPVRRLSLDGMASKPMQKSASDLLFLISRDESRVEGLSENSVDDRWLRTRRPSSSSSDRTSVVSAGSRPSSPLASRGVSPSRARAVGPSTRGSSPARVRPSSPRAYNSQSLGSALSFIADIKKVKKVDSNIEDAHQLRLLYNRHLQWRFANAWAVALLHNQKAKSEKMLYRVWKIIINLWRLVKEKRLDVQQLKLQLKLYSILDSQVLFLEEWASLEKGHADSLTQAIQDLEASTLRVPITEGARVDIKNMKEAVCSAVDVMSSMGSSLWSILPKVEGMNWLISEVADVAARQRAMLDECESLLGSVATLQLNAAIGQVEEDSLRTHILQIRQTPRIGNNRHLINNSLINSH